MARSHYKSYKNRSSQSRGRSRSNKKSSLRWIIVLLVIITAGVFITKQLGKPGDEIDDLMKESERHAAGGGNNGSGDGGNGLISGGNNDDPGGRDVLPPVKDGVTSKETRKLIAAADEDFQTGKVIAARNALNKILHDRTLSKKDREDVKQLLSKIAETWLFSKQVFDDDTLTEKYQVKDNDYFSTIAPKYKVPYQIIMRVNGITDERKLPLRKIKVVKGPFHVKIRLSSFNLDLYLQDQYIKSYQVGIGKPGKETPTGKWRVANEKLVKPTWYDKQEGKTYVADDPLNPLGARWIGIEGIEGDTVGKTDYALHGTKEPKSIGTKCSRGCIRLHDEDVIELFGMLTPVHSKVDIVD